MNYVLFYPQLSVRVPNLRSISLTVVLLSLVACSSEKDIDPTSLPLDFLPQTGQTLSFQQGDDGDWQSGVKWPEPRFANHSDGTFADNLTGLIWLKNLECFGFRLPWEAAIAAVNNLSDAGSGECGLADGSLPGDWRMPNVRELHSIAYGGSWADIPVPFYASQTDGYWSSTTVAGEVASAWFAQSEFIREDKKTSEYLVWPVRGGLSEGPPDDTRTYSIRLPKTGQTTSYLVGDDGHWQAGVALPEIRYRDNGDGTVSDTLSGLVWLKQFDCFVGRFEWYDALNAANQLADSSSEDCGLSDGSRAGEWRLPNVIELHSLVDYGRSEPALAPGYPLFDMQEAPSGWTSSPLKSNSGAFFLNLLKGGISEGDGFDLGFAVWPVRDKR